MPYLFRKLHRLIFGTPVTVTADSGFSMEVHFPFGMSDAEKQARVARIQASLNNVARRQS